MPHSILGLFGGSIQVISHGWNAYVRVSTVIHEKEKVKQILFSHKSVINRSEIIAFVHERIRGIFFLGLVREPRMVLGEANQLANRLYKYGLEFELSWLSYEYIIVA